MKKIKDGVKKLSDAISWLYGLWVKRLSDKEVQDNYVQAGVDFGDAVSYIYMGECLGFEKMLFDWAKWELEYSMRGYKTISLDDFIEYGGYGKPLNGLGIKRKPEEKVILHAEIYTKKYSNNGKPVLDLKKIIETGEAQSGMYILPSTKDE